jgi:hypothetical protein
MKMPRVRFTVRRLMIAVAVVAVLLFGGMQGRRVYRNYRLYSSHSAHYGTLEAICLRNLPAHRKQLESILDLTKDEAPGIDLQTYDSYKHIKDILDRAERRGEYYGRLKIKYERAAHRPWLPVEPDEPRPTL